MVKKESPKLVPVTEPEYSLLTEPWLGAVMEDGSIQRFGLVGLFENLDDVSSLVTDTEMEEPALFRLLLAIVYRALDPVLEDDYMEWWEDGRIPTGRVVDYLKEHEDRFWLFHPEHPFLQTIIEPKKDLPTDLDVLISEPNGSEPMSNRSSLSSRRMSYDEIARRLVAMMQYDHPLAHTPFKGLIGGPSSGVYYAGDAYLAQMSLIRLKTGHLMKDLLLSLIPLDAEDMFSFDDEDLTVGKPPWELPMMSMSKGADRRNPEHPKDLEECLVWMGRRAYLTQWDDGVTRILFSVGRCVTLAGLNGLEPMAAFKKVIDKTTKQETLIPFVIWSNTAFWRSLPSMIGITAGEKSGMAPMTLRWASYLAENGLLPDDYIGNVSVSTLVLDKKHKTKVVDFMSDQVSLPLSVIENPEKVRLIEKAVAVGEKMIRTAYWVLINNINLAEKRTEKEAKKSANEKESMAYDILGVTFYGWISEMSDLGDSAYEVWIDRAIESLMPLADEEIASASLDSMMGRVYKDKHYSTALSDSIFRSTLNKIRREELGK